MAWVVPTTTADDRDRIVGAGGDERVHAIAYEWLERFRTVRLFAYRLPAASFVPLGEPEPYAVVSTRPVAPLGPPEPVGSQFDLHANARIQLRILDNLWPSGGRYSAAPWDTARYGCTTPSRLGRTDPSLGG
jgi:hypothetical protein